MSQHQYSYVHNNPISLTDQTGYSVNDERDPGGGGGSSYTTVYRHSVYGANIRAVDSIEPASDGYSYWEVGWYYDSMQKDEVRVYDSGLEQIMATTYYTANWRSFRDFIYVAPPPPPPPPPGDTGTGDGTGGTGS